MGKVLFKADKILYILKKSFTFIILAVLLHGLTDTVNAGELMILTQYIVYADESSEPKEDITISAYYSSFDNVKYFSIRDIARAVSGTKAQFSFDLDEETGMYSLEQGKPYEEPETDRNSEGDLQEPETSFWDYYDEEGNLLNEEGQIIVPSDSLKPALPEYEYLELYINPMRLNGRELRYYSLQLSLTKDLYMLVTDIELMLDLDIGFEGESGLRINTLDGFRADLDEYRADGYFDLLNGVLLGDADTGEILFGVKEDNPVAVASTSKLMTYLVLARLIESGHITMDEKVTFSDNVEHFSYSGYGNMYLNAGESATVRELIGAMMLVSSNEAALALAEHAAGSEEGFVRMMNDTAAMLGLDSAVFYNVHGLPDYSGSIIGSARQNYMNASDLFRLASSIIMKYPRITDFTSKKKMFLESFNKEIENTNFLLYNMENAVGLKTGTTDEARCCLVACAEGKRNGESHTLIAVVLGAPSNIGRYQVPELLFKWGFDH